MKTKTKKNVPNELPNLPHKPAVTGIHLVVYSNCAPDKEFVLANGEHLKNLFELSESLARIDEKVFSHHVNKDRNDFSSWVEHVFNEKGLAETLKKSSSREKHEIVLLKHLLGKLLDHEKKN
ncbi:MAG: hypothetical protein AABX51_02595 [Nanoarchaeota archaeon]